MKLLGTIVLALVLTLALGAVWTSAAPVDQHHQTLMAQAGGGTAPHTATTPTQKGKAVKPAEKPGMAAKPGMPARPGVAARPGAAGRPGMVGRPAVKPGIGPRKHVPVRARVRHRAARPSTVGGASSRYSYYRERSRYYRNLSQRYSRLAAQNARRARMYRGARPATVGGVSARTHRYHNRMERYHRGQVRYHSRMERYHRRAAYSRPGTMGGVSHRTHRYYRSSTQRYRRGAYNRYSRPSTMGGASERYRYHRRMMRYHRGQMQYHNRMMRQYRHHGMRSYRPSSTGGTGRYHYQRRSSSSRTDRY